MNTPFTKRTYREICNGLSVDNMKEMRELSPLAARKEMRKCDRIMHEYAYAPRNVKAIIEMTACSGIV